jgi:hypothetical protein
VSSVTVVARLGERLRCMGVVMGKKWEKQGEQTIIFH